MSTTKAADILTTKNVSSEGMTPMMEAFCLEYVSSGGKNASESARRAGYADSNEDSIWVMASRLLRNVKVIRRIAEIREEVGVDSGINIEWALANLVAVIDRSMQREAIVDSEGNTYAYKYDSRGVVSAVKLIGEMKGWLEKKEPSKPPEVNLTDEELHASNLAKLAEQENTLSERAKEKE